MPNDPYVVSRTEPTLGTYDAPAMRISFGPGQADLIPMGRFVSFPSSRFPFNEMTEPNGRIDFTDGYRKYPLYRQVHSSGSTWRFRDSKGAVRDINEESFIQLLHELLS